MSGCTNWHFRVTCLLCNRYILPGIPYANSEAKNVILKYEIFVLPFRCMCVKQTVDVLSMMLSLKCRGTGWGVQKKIASFNLNIKMTQR